MHSIFIKLWVIVRSLLVVVGAISIIVTTAFLSWALKEKDPDWPNFNKDRFRYYDYINGDSLRSAFKKMFPPGQKKESVDRVLVKAGGGRIEDISPPGSEYKVIMYRYGPNVFAPKGESHIFVFDAEWRVVNVHPSGGSRLFPENPGKDEIRSQLNDEEH